jgi:hypothetical protein
MGHVSHWYIIDGVNIFCIILQLFLLCSQL